MEWVGRGTTKRCEWSGLLSLHEAKGSLVRFFTDSLRREIGAYQYDIVCLVILT